MEAWNELWLIVVVGILIPFVTGLLVKRSWPQGVKVVIAFVVSAIVGAGTVYLSNGWEGELGTTILLCFGAGQFWFWLLVKAVPGLNEWLQSHFIRDKPAA